MTTAQITADVDRGLAISAEIKALKTELTAIEDRLEQAALEGVTVPLEDADREGRQFLAHGTGIVLPVILESDQVIASFPAGGETHARLGELCGDQLPVLFREVQEFKRIPADGQKFRAALRQHFAPDQAAHILAASLQRDKAGIPKSRTVIPWDRAR